jgi:mandelate racemase
VLDAAGGLRRAPLQLRDGMLLPWDSPGIGLEWIDEAVARHRV